MALTLLRNRRASVDDWVWEHYSKLVVGDIVPMVEYTGAISERRAEIFPGLIVSICSDNSDTIGACKLNILVKGIEDFLFLRPFYKVLHKEKNFNSKM